MKITFNDIKYLVSESVRRIIKESQEQMTPAVYVGTYGKYNGGSLQGEWVNLTDFDSKEEFIQDKTEIINTIKELQKIMDKQDYQAWLPYISRNSIQYYSSPVNIRKANKRLPDKTIIFRGLEDYFKYIFIPSRKQSKVDEIRYINKSEVKAVQVLPNNSTVVYYNFIREDGKWKVNIPTL